jgi:hypothetical protein
MRNAGGFIRGDFDEAPCIASNVLPVAPTKMDIAAIHRRPNFRWLVRNRKSLRKLALALLPSFTGDLLAYLDWDEVRQEFRSIWNNLKEHSDEVFDLPAIAIRGRQWECLYLLNYIRLPFFIVAIL